MTWHWSQRTMPMHRDKAVIHADLRAIHVPLMFSKNKEVRYWVIEYYLVAFVVLVWREIFFISRNPSLARFPQAWVLLRWSRPLAMDLHVFLWRLMHLSRHEPQNSLAGALLLTRWVWARLLGEDVDLWQTDSGLVDKGRLGGGLYGLLLTSL